MNLHITYPLVNTEVLERMDLKLRPLLNMPRQDATKEAILRKVNIEVYEFLVGHLIPERSNVSVINTKRADELDVLIRQGTRSVVNLHPLNNVRYINKFLNVMNHSLPDAAIFIGCVESVANIKEKKQKTLKGFLFNLYWFFTFWLHRVIPKIPYLQKVYYFLSRSKSHWVTTAEILGRLVSCGFEIIEYKNINGLFYFAVIKTREPYYVKKPSFGPLFPMSRVGKNGKMIKVYKLRTMHPFAEFLQEYVTRLNGYNQTGKPNGDFRVATWGRFYRKYWLDELPQLLNVLKGELNIVGVRPLSETRYNELPEDLKALRIRFKPGCIPPYVALLMPDAKGNIEAERIYLSQKMKRPIYTDFKFFFLAMYNIFSGKIKSS